MPSLIPATRAPGAAGGAGFRATQQVAAATAGRRVTVASPAAASGPSQSRAKACHGRASVVTLSHGPVHRDGSALPVTCISHGDRDGPGVGPGLSLSESLRLSGPRGTEQTWTVTVTVANKPT